MQTTIEKQPKNTYELKVTHSADEVTQAKAQVVKDLAQDVKIDGFRKGKVPMDKVEEHLDKNTLYREIFTLLIKNTYPQLLKEHKLAPVSQPRITITAFEPYSVLKYSIKLAEKPALTLGDVKKEIRQQANDIISGNAPEKILEAILKHTKAEISEVLIEEESERMLTRLIDQLSQLGLTLEKYLESKKQTIEELQKEYQKGAERTLSAELAFTELIKTEGITVSNEEIEEALKANPDKKSRQELSAEKNRWYLESIIARSKLLDNLLSLAELNANTKLSHE